jgi:hypothetical protein
MDFSPQPVRAQPLGGKHFGGPGALEVWFSYSAQCHNLPVEGNPYPRYPLRRLDQEFPQNLYRVSPRTCSVHKREICDDLEPKTREALHFKLIEQEPPAQASFAVNAFQELAEGQFEGGGQGGQMAKPHLANPTFQIGDVDLVNSRVLRQVNLSPASFRAEMPNSLSELDAYVRGHPLSIDLAEALYLADALFRADQMREELKRHAPAPVCT